MLECLKRFVASLALEIPCVQMNQSSCWHDCCECQDRLDAFCFWQSRRDVLVFH